MTHHHSPDRPEPLAPNPLGVAIVLTVGAVLAATGVIVGLIAPPLSGGTIAGAALIALGGSLIIRLMVTVGGDSSWH